MIEVFSDEVGLFSIISWVGDVFLVKLMVIFIICVLVSVMLMISVLWWMWWFGKIWFRVVMIWFFVILC